jgi:hypothetical protein
MAESSIANFVKPPGSGVGRNVAHVGTGLA